MVQFVEFQQLVEILAHEWGEPGSYLLKLQSSNFNLQFFEVRVDVDVGLTKQSLKRETFRKKACM